MGKDGIPGRVDTIKTHLFYFSSTCNGFKIARDLAKELGETRIFSIPRIIHGVPDLSTDRIGLIFPMYIES